MKPPPVFMPVDFVGSPNIEAIADRQVVFHGTNKSGSLAFVRVLMQSYEHAGRSAEFVSTYNQAVASAEEIAQRAETMSGPALFSAHYLAGLLPPRQDRVLTTILRHPLPRAVSIYQWQIKRLRERDPAAAAAFPDLDTWLAEGKKSGFLATLQFGVGYGPDSSARRAQLSAAELLEKAKAFMREEVYALALAERFEESIFLFAHLLGLKEVALWRQDNRNAGRQMVDTLSAATIRTIETVFEPDFIFYEWAVREVFAPQMDRIQFGPAFEDYQARCLGQYKDRILVS